jgi:hypothetical protein
MTVRLRLGEQLRRLENGSDDPGQLLGSAKDLLEAVAKFVLEELGAPISGNPGFGHVWHLARERLGILPTQVPTDTPGAWHIKIVLQSSWMIVEQVNDFGVFKAPVTHGRTPADRCAR